MELEVLIHSYMLLYAQIVVHVCVSGTFILHILLIILKHISTLYIKLVYFVHKEQVPFQLLSVSKVHVDDIKLVCSVICIFVSWFL